MKKFRKAKKCEWSLANGSIVCFYLSLAHLRSQTCVERDRVLADRARTLSVQIHMQCPVCRRADTLSFAGLTSYGVQSLSRSLEVSRIGGTSIIWRMEQQPTVQESGSVTRVFGRETLMAGTRRAELLTLFGRLTSDKYSTGDWQRAEEQPIT